MSSKKIYRVKNWSQYNKGLKERGSLTFWFNSDELSNKWKANPNENAADKKCVYSSYLIMALLVIKNVYSLPYRQCNGFVTSIAKLLKLTFPIPCYTTLCRRAKKLNIDLLDLFERQKQGENLHLAFDGSGLKVYGEGEWKIKIHGKNKRRKWVKIHVGLDVDTKEIICMKLTDSKKTDDYQLADLLNKIPQSQQIGKVYADGAYDKKHCYTAVRARGGKAVFQLRKDAKLAYEKDRSLKDTDRNENLLEIQKTDMKAWKKKSSYHKRSSVENAFFRLKSIFSPKVYSRIFEKQKTETQVKCAILNKMIRIARPISYPIN